MKLRIGVLLAIIMALFFLSTSIAYATDPPDSDPSISNVKVNRNLITDGDVLIYGDYNLPYSTLPDEAVDATYIFRLIEYGIELGSITPFPYFDRGYNEGIFAFYFDEGIEWDGDFPSLTIRISQNPIYFETPESWDFEIPSSAYTLKTEQEDNQVELTIYIISMAQRLEIYHSDFTLLEDSPGGTVLSSPTGENYFRGTIYGIQAMGPDLFLVQVLEMDTTEREWTTDQFDEYRQRFDDTWAGASANATAVQFGVTTPMIMTIIFALPICLGAIIVSSIKFKRAEPGFVASIVVITGALLMGWFPGAIYATIFQLTAIYTAYVWFYARG